MHLLCAARRGLHLHVARWWLLMARIRSIKPEFWRSEAIARLPIRTRLTFIGLWSYVDDNGVGRDIDKLVAAELYPLEDDPRETLARVRGDLARLAEEGRITRYTVAGKPYLSITNWDEHQRIDKANKPRYPGPDDPAAEPAPPLTCDDAESRGTLAEPSRNPRGTLAEPPRLEQGNRGAGEQGAEDRTTLRSEPDGFAEWYDAYPLHKSRARAAKAYGQARRKVDPQTLLDAARRFAADPTRQRTYTPYPASWLNDGRWDDEGPARPQPASRSEQRHQHNLGVVALFAEREQQQRRELGAS
jgi:hypothetical protein